MKLRNLIPKFRDPVGGAVFPNFSFTCGAPGLLTEIVERPDHVMSVESGQRSCSLAVFDVLDRSFAVTFEPKMADNKVARLIVSTAGSRPAVYEMPEFGERANYRQVTSAPQYQSLIGQMRRAAAAKAASRSGMPWWGAALVVTLAFISSMLLLADKTPAQPALVAAAKSKEIMAPVVSASSSGDQLNENEKKILSAAVAQSGIELRSGGKPFVIFSDPNCPACRQLEERMAEIDKSLSPVVVPVSFKSNSAEAVASIAWEEAGHPLPRTASLHPRVRHGDEPGDDEAVRAKRVVGLVAEQVDVGCVGVHGHAQGADAVRLLLIRRSRHAQDLRACKR